MRDISRRRLSLSFVRRLSSFLLFLSSFFALFNSSSNSSTWCCSAEFCFLKPSDCCLKSHIVLLYESDCEWSELLGELAAFGGTLSEPSNSVRLWSSITRLHCVACCFCIDSFIEALSLSLLFFFFSSRFCLRWFSWSVFAWHSTPGSSISWGLVGGIADCYWPPRSNGMTLIGSLVVPPAGQQVWAFLESLRLTVGPYSLIPPTEKCLTSLWASSATSLFRRYQHFSRYEILSMYKSRKILW